MKKIVELRKEHNLSQRALADEINVTQATVSRWEKDQHTITGINLLKLSQYFEVSIDELLGNELNKD